MFGGRSFLVKVVKDESNLSEPPPVDYSRIFALATRSAIIIIAAYMGTDTLRQAVIHTVKTGVQAE